MSSGKTISEIRKDFPILSTKVDGKTLVYLDNAASSQKPKQVINAVNQFYRKENANIHRGNHYLSRLATEKYEQAREKTAAFINAPESREVIFTRGATEAINLVASSWGTYNLKEGDEILLTVMEHHANIVPWQMVARKTGAVIKVVPVNPRGELILDDYSQMLTDRTRLVAFCHISNALGTINPARMMIDLAHKKGALVLLDGAQSVAHGPVDVQELGCDFFVFSGHKMYAPTGIGVLYGRAELLDAMEPYQGGGDMIESVTFERTTFKGIPARFEAGTPNIAGAVGLAAAVDYLSSLDRKLLLDHESMLLAHATAKMREIDGLNIVGDALNKVSLISFQIAGIHFQDIADVLDAEGIAVRTGHHCTEPLMRSLGITGTARASFAFYNSRREVDRFVKALVKARKMLA